MNNKEVVLVTGLSGAGKSTALKILEDCGYICVDNLPPSMLLQLINEYDNPNLKLAVGVDTRSKQTLAKLPSIVEEIKANYTLVKVIFLDARLEVLIRRFSETRRSHPLKGNNKTVQECILMEQEIVSAVHQISHRIDTSELTANGLRELIKQYVLGDYHGLTIVFQSFGFKHGTPIDSDYIFDVRCLPNPHYVVAIKDFNGTQEPIIEYLKNKDTVIDMINDIEIFFDKWLKAFNQDNRNYITISIGCTGGKHRSVFIAEELSRRFLKKEFKVLTRHRHIDYK